MSTNNNSNFNSISNSNFNHLVSQTGTHLTGANGTYPQYLDLKTSANRPPVPILAPANNNPNASYSIRRFQSDTSDRLSYVLSHGGNKK
ncbi:hypothetical protein DOTSEDRAFT_29235 [Dothistroma septosporum NZE10]|uniref:Uncharacterized protein n=1 Tax=Dothistroma septosporum (strain NZE10 / CBS 128990) TaxID=675120 RepID=M2Y172_DOTSN|nr:hypothetical protein DOTSEDRAFT_29235 [Dothistroma septosporum NZE10]